MQCFEKVFSSFMSHFNNKPQGIEVINLHKVLRIVFLFSVTASFLDFDLFTGLATSTCSNQLNTDKPS